MTGTTAVGDTAFLARLLHDAERMAGDGRTREAFVLLRWASRVSLPESEAMVLLTYHRIRTREEEYRRRVQGDSGATGWGRPRRGAAVEADALGFPVPRFPTRAPELDRTAFVPAPRPGLAAISPREGSPARARAARGGWVGILVLAVVGAAAVVAPLAPDLVSRLRGGGAEPAGRVEEAARVLEDGDAATALALTEGLAQPSPQVLLIRGRSYLALADTASGFRALVAAAAHEEATGDESEEAAHLLAALPGREAEAAAAYLQAFSAGLSADRWPAVLQALERAGRHGQARRLRQLSAGQAGDTSP